VAAKEPRVELTQLIAALADPAAYPAKVDAVDVRQTHISVVFLAGEHVYKIKKPVNLGFLDFSTLAKRRHFCQEEVRLNARLAPDVYLGVVPIVADGDRVRVDGPGEPIEWAVKMRRLADEQTLESRLERGQVSDELARAVARKIADFHRTAETNSRIAAFGRFEVVAANARGNFEHARGHVGEAISRAVFDRLQTRTEAVLAERHELIESRATRGVPRDTHGDLRLDHIYVDDGICVDDGAALRLTIIDCIEFNEQFRFADPVADVAFLAMDFKFEGRGDLAAVLVDEYFHATADEEGRQLLPFYTSYRAAVRGKVEGFKAAEAEVRKLDREEALKRARGYWLLALGEIEPPERKPCLVLVGGLPGTGKSTLAAGLAERAGCEVIRSDVVRKQLAGADAGSSQAADFGQGIYSPEWNERTYAECLRQAEAALFEGRRVIVDASFRENHRRRAFFAAAKRWGVPAGMFVCQADGEIIKSRLAARRGDASDADWAIYRQAALAWEPPDAALLPAVRAIATGGTRDEALGQAFAAMQAIGIAE
jgi:aminoglycoside phosphotransferase family enzyme/predicted kinase